MSTIGVGANAREIALKSALLLVRPERQQKVKTQFESLYGTSEQMFARTIELLSKQVKANDEKGIEVTKDVLALIYLEREIGNAYRDKKSTIEMSAFSDLREEGVNEGYTVTRELKNAAEKKRIAHIEKRAHDAEEKRLASRTPYQQALEEEIPRGPDCLRDRNAVTDFLNKKINHQKDPVDGKELTIAQKIALIENIIDEIPWYHATPTSYKDAISVLKRQQEIEETKGGAPSSTPVVESRVVSSSAPKQEVKVSKQEKTEKPAEVASEKKPQHTPKVAHKNAPKAKTGEKGITAEQAAVDDNLMASGVLQRGAREETDGAIHELQRGLMFVYGELKFGDDGDYGKNTKAKVEQLQEEYGLRKDGVVGDNTKLALQVAELKKITEAMGGSALNDAQKAQIAAEFADVKALQDKGIALSGKGKEELTAVIAKLDGKVTQSDSLYAVVQSVKEKTNQIG